MKKLSLLLGALGGATAGYLFSNKKLREQLSKVKDAEEAAKIFGEHLQRDGRKLGKHIQEFMGSEVVQANVAKAKKYAKEKMEQAKEELKDLAGEGGEAAVKGVSRAKRKVERTVRKLV